MNLANAMKLAEKRIDLESELSGNIIAYNSKWTNNNVKLTIKSNKEILDIDSWKKNSQKKFEKIFENNQNINTTIQTEN